MKKLLVTAIVCAFMSAPAMADINIVVPGTACPFFAGQTFGSIPAAGEPYFDWDIGVLGTMPPWIDVTGFGGTIPSITATGLWSHTPSFLTGPEGYAGYDLTNAEYVALGISPVGTDLATSAPLNSLLGVFLTDTPPVLPAPSPLVFGDDMTSPLVQQTFVIGSGLSGINIPTGATRLFFGLNNGYEWSNNIGELDVTIVPAPAAVLLGMLGLGAAGLKLRKRA